MEAGRLQQTRKGNADDLQPDVSLDLELHGRKTEGLRNYEGTHVECRFRADWDKKVIGQEESGNKTSEETILSNADVNFETGTGRKDSSGTQSRLK